VVAGNESIGGRDGKTGDDEVVEIWTVRREKD
jgi:hypothetical protein